ncbi:HAMP domain-containing histidine kinase [Flavobacterium sp. NRK F10]|uniref:sensor histidine kinase n=1 Tax=Flavobacterium sp. NRK F10 TaxID=2954931 RepID=UPI00209030BE|nr:HAMP domain-containing sensor histidine kinase [Flavobacterium sp. NRK F10]MCO6175407.1 HAMP domain-containing histidine kinase [Flavobacterium sp. NRK F10]
MLLFFLRNRKYIHYFLFGCFIFLLLLLILLVFNEQKINAVAQELKANKHREILLKHSYLAFLKSQSNFNDFLTHSEEYDGYLNSLQEMDIYLDSLAQFADHDNTDPSFKKSLQLKRDKLREAMGILGAQQPDRVSKINFVLPEYEFKDVLNSIDVSTSLKVDSVAKKSLFNRLGDAFKGKVAIQKEQMDIVITLKYGKELVQGSIEDQLTTAFKTSNLFYSGILKEIQRDYNQLLDSSQSLVSWNNEIISTSRDLFAIYDAVLVDYETQLEKESEDYHYKNTFLRYSIILFVLLLLSLSIVFITKLAYDYEEKLEWINIESAKHLKFKNRILGILSHELRSPLHIISILTQKLLKTTVGEAEKTSLKAIDFTVSSLLLQANQFLEYTKDPEQRNQLKYFDFDLRLELDEILNSLGHLVENNGNKLYINNGVQDGIIVTADKVKLQQLFLNIVGNANKFTNKGTILVFTGSEVVDADLIQLRVMVKDTGVGISEEDLEKIFEPYYQGILSDEIENFGAGLGLNLCKEIVELFSGTISVQSKKNKGTSVVFKVNLTLKKEHHE